MNPFDDEKFTKISFIKIVRSFDSAINLAIAKLIPDSYEMWKGSMLVDCPADFMKIASITGKVSRGEILVEDGKFYPSVPQPMSNTEIWGV